MIMLCGSELIDSPTLCFSTGEGFLDSRVSRDASRLIARHPIAGISGLKLHATLKIERCPVAELLRLHYIFMQ